MAMSRRGEQTAGGSDAELFWWCLRHNAVEQGPGCPGKVKLGPFASYDEASAALDLVKRRNDAWDSGEGDADVR
jgi:hypothetical protein